MDTHDYAHLALVNGGGNPELAREVAQHLHVDLTPIEIVHHRDGEPKIGEVGNLRRKRVVNLTSLQQPDRHFINAAIQADIARRAAPECITGIFPYFAYTRQDRRDVARTSITVEIPIEPLAKRYDEIILCDLHSEVPVPLFEAYSNNRIIVDHLYSRVIRLDWLSTQDLSQATILSNDIGAVKPVRSLCRKLQEMGHPVRFCLADKDGTASQGIDRVLLASDGDIENTDVFAFDDMCATGTTADLVSAAVRERNPRSYTLFFTHAVIPDDEACHKLADAAIDRIVTTNSVPISDRHREILGPKLTVVSLAPFFAAVTDASFRGGSMSRLFYLDGFRQALRELGLQ